MRYFVYIVILVVAAAVVAGFFIVGSPQKERERRFDEQRASHLQNIQWQIVNFWQAKDRLPRTLKELEDPISGFSAPTDPETGERYGYEVKGGLAFTLCADFNLPSAADSGTPKPAFPGDLSFQSWQHPAGRHCFERAIDPEIYARPKPERPD